VWPLKTFPSPDAAPERMRILAYTCAGGYDGPSLHGKTFFLDMTARRKLLARAMSFQPDAVIANGDHIYWDAKPRSISRREVCAGADLAEVRRCARRQCADAAPAERRHLHRYV
jgi:hypothetical protein